MECSSSLPKRPLLLSLAFSLLLVLIPSAEAAAPAAPAVLTYHNGPLLTGNVNLALVWYGQFGRTQKIVIRHFLKSLNSYGNANLEPRVSGWWRTVESYAAAAGGGHGRSPGIKVKVVRQVSDTGYSVGKIITADFIPQLVQKASGGNPNVVVAIFTDRMVSVQGLCMGKCSLHGAVGNGPKKQPYIVVMNPETECPGACAWPFHKADDGPNGPVFQPPNGNVGADSMVIALASGLAEAVTNPFNTGFFQGEISEPIEAATACSGIFGSGATAGYTGKVRIDPKSGGAFNAHGVNGKKFLLPAVWSPKTKSCWTTM
ncbi:protein EXORDIUM-like 2 [Malania oleifera]|uniref:protein EXORDIUM-like 2 n=1 Tax=Malania oleifera TaxID=397392 RepID=UPI0025AEBBB5|nr:protein EXORDIUM-like 2 [Malania oleifera]